MIDIVRNWIKSEMHIVLNAKGAFICTLILAVAIAYFLASWRYDTLYDALIIKHDGIIKAYIVSTQNLRDNILFKEGLITDYRERLGLISAKGSEFSRMTHAELKDKALSLVGEMRNMLERYQKRSQMVHDKEWTAMARASTEKEKRKLWDKFTSATLNVSNNQRAEYDKQFKVDTIILRDELLSRLPKEAKKDRSHRMYEHPTNPIGMGMVADDLERLAKLLK